MRRLVLVLLSTILTGIVCIYLPVSDKIKIVVGIVWMLTTWDFITRTIYNKDLLKFWFSD